MYNFDKEINRKNTYSLKWDLLPDCLPMWVADMDFECAPKIKEALINRVNIGAYGYSLLPEELYDAYISFWKDRHNVSINRDSLVFCTGVVPALSSIVRRMSRAGEYVLIQAPVYNIFYNCITNNGRKILSNDLVLNNGKWEIDFVDLEEKMSNPLVNLMILCNPHNPVGRIWTKEELNKISELADKYNVLVVSDEIHCDIVSPNLNYVPYMSVSDKAKYNSITCIAPSKCFNMAGLNTSMVVIDNVAVRAAVERGLNNDEIAENNFFAAEASITALNECRDWLNEMNEYVYKNKLAFVDYINNNIKGMKAYVSDATYLEWVDISGVSNDAIKFCEYLKKEYKLFITPGTNYSVNSSNYVRINLATQLKNVLKTCEILKEASLTYKE